MPATSSETPRRRNPWLLLPVLALVGAAVLVAVVRLQDAEPENPLADRTQYADPDSGAARAAAAAEEAGEGRAAELLSTLARVPAGIWLTPEEHPAGEVGGYVATIAEAADDADQVPVLVVYGVPDRDCSGGFSAGGLSAQDYPGWVGEIADALADAERAIVVLEPDALVGSLDCGNREQRVRLVAEAAEQLDEAGATVYLDGGHSHWKPAEDVAELLRDAGVERVRGFATNVANYQSDRDERSYAEELSGLLDGAHYVIDRGRSGPGVSGEPTEWCNPPGRAVGARPEVVDDGQQDAWLWVKPPGESDGECNGGPPAGDFWTERALELLENAGW
ncbi:glycoside hydrolase family 6 protein [Nocardioides ferulae]|uniref:glycoside hydrolase family 6 protein n=1 Tax=Nocardioides ferulae TaxID=2340821 RepID=UPI0013DDA7FE|nr:glycoside hydrolase family 6 protein [Nocardioides ferulae]